jgi:hypothetical protein
MALIRFLTGVITRGIFQSSISVLLPAGFFPLLFYRKETDGAQRYPVDIFTFLLCLG